MRRNAASILCVAVMLCLSGFGSQSIVSAQTHEFGGRSDVVYQGSCPSPRPPVRVDVNPQGDGRIKVTLTAGNGALTLVRFGQMQNARVTVPDSGQQLTSNQEIKPPAGATSFAFDVILTAAVQSGQTPPAATVPMTIFDGCGADQPWSTFVGGGATALQSTASIEDAQATEGNSGTTQVTFTVKLSVPSSQPVTYTYNTSSGSATSPSDFVAASGAVTFNPGETQKSVTVQVRGDFDDESDETFTITLSNPINGGLARSQATARIINDDHGPSANGDTYVASIGQQLTVAAPGLLSNDQNGSQAIQVVSFGGLDAGGAVDSNAAGSTRTLAPGGSLTVRANGSFDFTPPTTAGATFSFRYRAESLSGQSEATVIINIQTGPAANADPNYNAVGSTQLSVPEATGVLANDTRGTPPGNVASFGTAAPTTVPAGTALDLGNGGSLTVQANGSFTFTAPSTVTGPFTFQYRLTNPAGSSDATVTITVARGPVITTTSGSTTFSEGSSPVLIDPGVTITNPGGGNITSATVVIANPLDGASESLAATVLPGGITQNYVAGTHTLTLTGPGSAADFQTALRGVTYENTSNGPSTTARTIQFEGIANAQTGNQATKSVTVGSVNDAPVLANIEPGALVFAENDPPLLVTTTLTVSDLDSADLVGATVGITNASCVPGEDVLSFATQNGISGVYTPATCTMVLSGTSSVANYQTALRSILYSNSSNSPTTAARTVGFQVTDGIDGSNTVSRGLTVGSTNDLPVVTTTAGPTAFVEAGGAVTIDGGVTVTDLDNTQLASATVSISNVQDGVAESLTATASGSVAVGPAGSTLTLTGPATLANFQTVLQTVTYNNTSNAPTTTDRTISFAASDGVGSSTPATKTVTITAVNSAPVVTTTGSVTPFTENGPAATVDAGVTVNDADNTTLASATITITNVLDGAAESLDTDLTGLGAITKGTASGAGTFTLTLTGPGTTANFQTALQRVTYTNSSNTPTTAPDRVVSFVVSDGAVPSNTATKSVSVAAADDPPTAVDDSATVLEDAAATAIDVLTNDTDVDGGAKSISTVQNPSANGGAVLITGLGTGLTYQPAADYCNTPPGAPLDTFTYTLNGGSVGTVSVTVTCVNDAPAFVMGPNQGPVDNQDGSGAAVVRTVNNWATGISKGPTNESTQNLTFIVTTNNGGLFSTPPAISATGTLTYTPDIAVAGTATVTVILEDDGGDANGGIDTFAPAPNTFTIQTVFPLPDAIDDGPSADYTANGGIPIDIPDSIGVTDNDVLRGATITGYGASTGAEQTTIGTATATAQGGTVALNANGSFRYTPPCSVPGGSDTFKYRLTNGGGSDTATVTITVNAGVCFVQHSAAAGGNGSITAPYQQLDDVPGTRPNNGAVYVIQSATPSDGSITLKNGESLLGQGVAASGNLPFTPATRTDLTVLPAAGTTPTLSTSTGNLITLGVTNTLMGFEIGNVGAGTGIAGTNFGTLNISTVAITTNGRALNLDTGTVNNGTITSITSIGGANNVRLNAVATTGAAFNLGTGALTGATGDALVISGGSGSVSYAGSITSGGAHSVNISGKTGGTVALSGTVTDNDTGISLTSNPGATINFTNVLTISTGTNAGFTATGGGTVSSSNTTSTIITTTASALNVANTNIGAAGLRFQSISSNGGANGIILNNTGTTAGTHGGLTVTGVGSTDGSGGTIQNTTGRGASFITTRDVSLKNMNFTSAGTSDLDADNSGLTTGDNLSTNAAIHLEAVTNATLDNLNISGGAEQGINGHNVTVFRLLNSSITNVGNGPDEDGIHFYNMLGTSEITNTSITSSGDDNMNIQNNTNLALPSGMTAVTNLTITGGNANTGVLGSGYLMGIRGTSNTTVTIDGVTSNNNFSGGVVIDTYDTATSSIEVMNSTLTNNNDGIQVSSNNGNTKFDIHDNLSFAGTDFVRINILKAAFSTGGTLQGKIRNNPIVVTDGQTTDAISVFQAGDGILTVSITGNDIDYRGTQRAILLQGGQDGSGQLNATVTGNTIDLQLDGTGNAVAGVLAQVAVASPSGDNTNMCADIGGAGALRNVFTHSLGNNIAGGDLRVRQRFVTTVTLPGYGGANSDNAAVVAYLAARNTLVNSPTATVTNEVGVTPGAGGFVNGGGCAQPVFP